MKHAEGSGSILRIQLRAIHKRIRHPWTSVVVVTWIMTGILTLSAQKSFAQSRPSSPMSFEHVSRPNTPTRSPSSLSWHIVPSPTSSPPLLPTTTQPLRTYKREALKYENEAHDYMDQGLHDLAASSMGQHFGAVKRAAAAYGAANLHGSAEGMWKHHVDLAKQLAVEHTSGGHHDLAAMAWGNAAHASGQRNVST